jgi:hypothetical protein
MSDAVATPFSGSTADFTQLFGMDPAELTETPEDAPQSMADADEALEAEVNAEDESAEINSNVSSDERNSEVASEGEDAEPAAESKDEEEEPAVEVPKLPFAAVAKGEAVDPVLLSEMTLTLKADGEEVTKSLADVVRLAQSEPAAQRKARAMESKAVEYERRARDFENEVAEVRRVALNMARDPDYYAKVVAELEEFDAPEARAQRAETALAERDRQQREARERAERETRITQFATSQVAPTLNRIVESSPLVSQEELLGRFMTDTAQWTVNGVIPPEHHDAVAEYLRTGLASFAAERQTQYATRESKLKAETLRTQRERQAAKNQRAGASRPVGASGALQAEGKAAKPATYKEAEQSALGVLLNGLT